MGVGFSSLGRPVRMGEPSSFRATKSFTSSGVLPPATPALSQKRLRESAQAFTKLASDSLTLPSTAAKSSSIRVKVSTNRRLRLLFCSRSACTMRRKKLGRIKPG